MWNWITFHYGIDNSRLLTLNLGILNCLLFLGLLPFLLTDDRHSFLLKVRLRVLLLKVRLRVLLLKVRLRVLLLKVRLRVLSLKVSRLLAFFAFFTLFSYDFLSCCCYFVVLEILLEFRLGLVGEIRLAQESFLFVLEFKKEPNSI